MKTALLMLLLIPTLPLAGKEEVKQVVITTESFVVECEPNGSKTTFEESSYEWFHNGRPINVSQFSVTNYRAKGDSKHVIKQSIKKTNAAESDNGTYTCRVGLYNASEFVFVTDEPKITILDPSCKDVYEDKNMTIQARVEYQGGHVTVNLVNNSTKIPVQKTVLSKEVYGEEIFKIFLSNDRKEQDGYYYVALYRNGLDRKFTSSSFYLSFKRRPPTPCLSQQHTGPSSADFNLTTSYSEPSHRYDTVKNFNVSFSTMWGQTGKKVLNAPVSEFRLNSLYPWTLYNVTVTAHGSQTQSDPSFLNFSTTFDTDKAVGFFVIPKTQEVCSNASGPIFPVCDEHQSLGNCTTAVIEIRNVSFTFPDWCYLLDFNRTASREELVVVSEELPYFRVVSCSLCHRLKACRANNNGFLVAAVSIVAIAVAVWLFLCKSKSQSRDITETVENPSQVPTGGAEAVSDSTKTCQSAPTKGSTEFWIDQDGTDESEVTLSEGHISDLSASLENCQISSNSPTEFSEESQDEESIARCSETPDLVSSSDIVRAVREKRASATNDTHFLEQPPTRREWQLGMRQIQGGFTETNQNILDLHAVWKKKETSES